MKDTNHWNTPPKVDAAVQRLAHHIILLLDDSVCLKDLMDWRFEADLKRIYCQSPIAPVRPERMRSIAANQGAQGRIIRGWRGPSNIAAVCPFGERYCWTLLLPWSLEISPQTQVWGLILLPQPWFNNWLSYAVHNRNLVCVFHAIAMASLLD